MMSSRSSPPRERLASSGSVLSDDSEVLEGLDDVDFEVSDPRLRDAVDKAGKEKNIMPLIKEELRLSILTRRNKEGKGDIVIEEKKQQVKRASVVLGLINKICFKLKNGKIKIYNVGISITDSYASRERKKTSPPGTKPTGSQKMQKEKERL